MVQIMALLAFCLSMTWVAVKGTILGIEEDSTEQISEPAAVWSGYLHSGEMHVTISGTDIEDIMDQIRRRDAEYDASNIGYEVTVVERDSGKPLDLPDPGKPDDIWRGPGGPWTYGDDSVSYNFTCGKYATAGDYRTKDGSKKLRKKGDQSTVTLANSCSRHYCKDTTGFYVCNHEDTELIIPYYNIGWMIDRLGRLCCDPSVGKSGEMWHYSGKYSVVLGYANCRTDDLLARPYEYGKGNNGFCVDTKSIPYNPPRSEPMGGPQAGGEHLQG